MVFFTYKTKDGGEWHGHCDLVREEPLNSVTELEDLENRIVKDSPWLVSVVINNIIKTPF